MRMRIWVDADGAPRDVRDVVRRATERLPIEAVLVGSGSITPPAGEGRVTTATPARGGDADDGPHAYISRHAEPGDVVVTQDARLAALLVPRGIAALDIRGAEHAAPTTGIDESLLDLLEDVRGLGGGARGADHGPPPYDARAKREFAGALDRLLTRLLRESPGRTSGSAR